MLYPQSLPSKVYNMEGGEGTFTMGKPKALLQVIKANMNSIKLC